MAIIYINFIAAYATPCVSSYVPRGCSHHTNEERIYLESDMKSPRGLYCNTAQLHLNGFASFDGTKEKFCQVAATIYRLPLLKGDGRIEHEKEATDFAVRYVLAKC